MKSELKKKIADFVALTVNAGATRTQVMQRFHLKADELSPLLEELLHEGQIRQSEIYKKKLGRPAIMFFGPHVLGLTANEDRSTSGRPTYTPATPIPRRKTQCQICGTAIPIPETGRPPTFCGEKCRAAAHGDGGLTLQEFLGRTNDLRRFIRACLCLVMADLSIRGFQVTGEFWNATVQLIVHDGITPIFLTVFPISSEGSFPDDYMEHESVALVYRDGRILYTGKTPLVTENEPETPILEESTDGDI